ncbi:MAG: hypothetical protein Kow0025_14650 [Thermodesulfovibrionales bacterium]
MRKLLLLILAVPVLLLGVAVFEGTAQAESGFFNQNCAACHSSAGSTCAGCHAHGVHSNSSKSNINLTAATDKASYSPGETVSVTINGGYRSGWVRAILYDQNGAELARSTGPATMGGGSSFPIILSGPAPSAPGSYTFTAAWYGNQYDRNGAAFGNWVPDPGNPNHGEERVATNSFQVVGASGTPDITVTDSVSPAADLQVPFGGVTVGGSSDQTVTVRNDGTADLLLGSISAPAPPFSVQADNCSGQTLTPSSSCTVTVRFAPSSSGAFSDNLLIPSDDPDENPVSVALSGNGTTAATPDIAVTDSVAPAADLQVPFGDVATGGTATQTVTVSNAGNAALNIGTIGSANALAAPFAIAADNCSGQTLAQGASCSFDITFSPSAAGAFSDSLDIPSDDPDENPVTVSVSGNGASSASGDIAVTDSVAPAADLQVPFGDVATGGTATQTVTVANAGNAALNIGTIGSANALAAPFAIAADGCSGQALQPSATCEVTVTFSPTASGPFSDSFDIPSDDPDENPVTVSVSGNGSAVPVADISVTDSAGQASDLQVPFGQVTAGGSSTETVTVANEGSADLLIGDVASGNPLAAPFEIVSDGCSGQTLASGAQCVIEISFSPADEGQASDSFSIPSNDPDEGIVTVSVSGMGLAAGGNHPPSVPSLMYPAMQQEQVETSPTFKWKKCADPDGDPVTYMLYISTDPSFEGVAPVQLSGSGQKLAMAGSGGLLLFGLFAPLSRRRRIALLMVIALLAAFALASCGSSGGGTAEQSVSYTATGLSPNTTYYWKVVAVDGAGGEAESEVRSFTTGS